MIHSPSSHPSVKSGSLLWTGVDDRIAGDRLLGRVDKVSKATTEEVVSVSEASSDSHTITSEPVGEGVADSESSSTPLRHKDTLQLTLRRLPPVLKVTNPVVPRTSPEEMTTDHHFLCWPAWPIYSALVKHGLMQGTGCTDCIEDDKSPAGYLSLPEPLRPTPLQLAMPHLRWIDRFPFRRLRDNMILLTGLIDLNEFVRDLFGMSSLMLRPNSQWPTWEPESWIIGPEFSTKWGYLFL